LSRVLLVLTSFSDPDSFGADLVLGNPNPARTKLPFRPPPPKRKGDNYEFFMFEESERPLFQMKVFDGKKFPLIIFSISCQNISWSVSGSGFSKIPEFGFSECGPKHWFLLSN
jgi:hypothetical protein